MLNNNPFSLLAEAVSPLAMQGFIIAMVILIAVGTIMANEVPTAKCIIKDLSIPIVPNI